MEGKKEKSITSPITSPRQINANRTGRGRDEVKELLNIPPPPPPPKRNGTKHSKQGEARRGVIFA